MLPHQEQRIRWVYEHHRDSQQYSSSDKGKKKKKNQNNKKLKTKWSQTAGLRNFQRNTIHIYGDVIHNRTTHLYSEATAAKSQFTLINEHS